MIDRQWVLKKKEEVFDNYKKENNIEKSILTEDILSNNKYLKLILKEYKNEFGIIASKKENEVKKIIKNTLMEVK